jgi:hypothetical protein
VHHTREVIRTNTRILTDECKSERLHTYEFDSTRTDQRPSNNYSNERELQRKGVSATWVGPPGTDATDVVDVGAVVLLRSFGV